MPSISEFYGIKIYMYWNDVDRHQLPHFHAYYSEYEATFKLNGEIIEGKMPKTAQKLIKIWAMNNLLILNFTWNKIKNKEPFDKIKGLK